MPLFTRRAVEPEPPAGGGLAFLRAKVKAYTRWPQSHTILAREMQVSGSDIDAFIAGADFTSEQIAAALDHLGLKATYDREADLLRSTNAAPATMGVAPPIGSGGVNLPPGFTPGKAGDPPPLFQTPQQGSSLKPYEKPQGWA
jgi:hypothetical protein